MFNKGFTLLEVMVALAIFAVAAMALSKVAMQYTHATGHAILRTKAQFVAMNEIARMEIQQEWLSGTASTQVQEQDETWQIDKSSQSTMSPNVQRIDVKVSIYDRNMNKTTGQITQLTFFNYRQGQNGSS